MEVNHLLKWLKKVFVPHEHNGYHPHFLRHKSVSLFLFLIIIIEVGFFIQVFYVFDKTNFLAAVLPGVLTSLANDERAELNLSPLSENALLAQAAKLKAEDMATKNYFAHVSPEGLTPWHWLEEVGYRYMYAGENLAVNFFESADVAEAWMNSPSHRANIVKENYTEIGIGVASGTYQGRHTIFVAQFFGTPLATASAPLTSSETVTLPPPESSPEEEVAVAPEGEAVEVLGEETQPREKAPSEPAPVTPERAVTKIEREVEKKLSSPRHLVNYAYTSIAFLALVAIALAFFVKSELRHPGMVARGASLIAIIAVLSFINLKVLNLEPKIPAEGVSANAVSAVLE